MSDESDKVSIGAQLNQLIEGRNFFRELDGDELKLLFEIFAVGYFSDGEKQGIDSLRIDTPSFALHCKDLGNEQFVDVNVEHFKKKIPSRKYHVVLNSSKLQGLSEKEKLELCIELTKEITADIPTRSRWVLLKSIILDTNSKHRAKILQDHADDEQKESVAFKKLIDRFKLEEKQEANKIKD